MLVGLISVSKVFGWFSFFYNIWLMPLSLIKYDVYRLWYYIASNCNNQLSLQSFLDYWLLFVKVCYTPCCDSHSHSHSSTSVRTHKEHILAKIYVINRSVDTPVHGAYLSYRVHFHTYHRLSLSTWFFVTRFHGSFVTLVVKYLIAINHQSLFNFSLPTVYFFCKLLQ